MQTDANPAKSNRLKLYAAIICGLYPVSCKGFVIYNRLLNENGGMETPATYAIFAFALLAFGVSNYGVMTALIRCVPQRLQNQPIGCIIVFLIIGASFLLFFSNLLSAFGNRFYPTESPVVQLIPTAMTGIASYLVMLYVRDRRNVTKPPLPIARRVA